MTLRRRALLASAVPLLSLPGSASAAQTLTVAAFPLVDEIARAALPAWRALHPGVDVKVVSRQYADHHTLMSTALATGVALPDVMALESSYVGRFAQGGGLEDLARPPYDIARHRARLVRYAYDQAVARSGAVVAMPVDIGPGCMLYRHDVLARAGVDAAALTGSWDDYIEAGARIKAATGAHLIGHVQQVKDIVIRTGLGPGEGLYFDAQDRVLVESERFRRAFGIARAIRRRELDARVRAWSNEWAEGLKRGRLATELSGAWLVGQMNSFVAPSTRGLWRAAPLPAGAQAAYGGAFYALPRRADSARKALAWAFVEFMTLDRDRQLGAFKDFDAFPALLEAHDDPFFDAPVDFLGGQPARRLWRDVARRIAAVPVHKQSGFADEVVGGELEHVLERGKDIATALADARRLLEKRVRR